MRITQLMTTGGAVQHISDNQEIMARMQERINSGKNFSVASDDPVNSSISLGLRSSLTNITNYLSTNDQALGWMNATDFAMQQMEDVATKAQNLILSGLNDTLGSSERANALAKDMGGLLEQALEIGNSKHLDHFLFSGVYTETQPFTMTGTVATYSPRPALPTPAPAGISSPLMRAVAPNQKVAINVMGEDAFLPFMQSLSDAQQALLANDTTALRTALNGLQSGVTTLDQTRTSLGARIRQVDTAGGYLEKAQIEAKALLSSKEDANLAEAVMMLKGQETTYQAVLQVSQRAMSASSLFDLMG